MMVTRSNTQRADARHWGVFPIAALLLLATPAFAETFDYTIDRFEADGNVNGPFDGTPDVVDEFDDGVLAPWVIRRGTGSESGGFAHVQTPGVPITLPGIFPVGFEASAIGRNGVLDAFGGDGVLRLTLPQQAIDANDSVSFDLATIEGQALYYTGIVLTNYNTDLANLFTPPYPIGLAATAHSERISFTNEVLNAQHQAIAPSSVTGPIVLELRFDGSTREVTTAVSVDGGNSFAAVFDPMEVETDWGDITVQSAVAALDGTCPGTQRIKRATFSKLRSPLGGQKMKALVESSRVARDQGVRGLRLVLTDEGAGGATVFDVTIPNRATAFQHPCGPDEGWVANGFVNTSGALAPDCIPGSAKGLRRVRMKLGRDDVRIDVKDAELPAIVGPIRAAFYFGTGPVNECDGWVADAPCRASANSAKCASVGE
jgi:hypothetical protein